MMGKESPNELIEDYLLLIGTKFIKMRYSEDLPIEDFLNTIAHEFSKEIIKNCPRLFRIDF